MKTATALFAALLAKTASHMRPGDIESVAKHAYRRTVGSERQSIYMFSKYVCDLEQVVTFDFRDNGEALLLDCLGVLNFTTLFDVGANRGQWARYGLDKHPHGHVHCFEIVPETYAE